MRGQVDQRHERHSGRWRLGKVVREEDHGAVAGHHREGFADAGGVADELRTESAFPAQAGDPLMRPGTSRSGLLMNASFPKSAGLSSRRAESG